MILMGPASSFRSAIAAFALFGAVLGPCVTRPANTAEKAADSHGESRVAKGLLALYEFRSTGGTVVQDRSGAGNPANLRIADVTAVRRSKGMLQVLSKTVIRTEKPATRITDAIRKSREITLEAWIRPADTKQSGPARIVTLSKDSGERNATLGQDGGRFEVRLRTTRTSTNGMPAINSPQGTAAAELTHVVYTRNRRGFVQFSVNGKLVASRRMTGATSNWDRSFRLALANELTGDRPWRGTFYLVAVYNRALSFQEVEKNFLAGAGPGAEELRLARRKRERNVRLFTAQVAPLLARHCLECHGGKSVKGRLNLAQRITALRGGESGRVILPGNAAKSRLWQSVKSGEMPKDRQRLSDREKAVLRVWIDGGANWPLEKIDPKQYVVPRRPDSNWLRRLTVAEYVETVRAATGVDIAADARKFLPRDHRADGFSNTAYNLNVDLGHVEAYSRLARAVVGKLDAAKFAARFTKRQDLSDANMRALISGMGKWLLRGPLKEHEIAAFHRVSQAVVKEGGDFKEAAAYLIEAMLQSPRFLYRMEIQRGDGQRRPADGWELASRLSYILWGGPPDTELIRAAEAGELDDLRRVEAQVRRMLKDRRAVTRSTQFIADWLNLDRLDNLRPNPKRFPKWDSRLAADMRAETLAFFKEIAWTQKRPLSHLMNAQVTFLTPRLAKHYGLKPKPGDGLSHYDLSKTPSRGGLLTQGSVLTVGGDEASMVARGLFVLNDLLRGEVKDPPPCVDTTPVPTKPGMSQRSVALARIASKSCGGCHGKFEPLSFGLEKFDGLGSYHEKDEHGNTLRDDGEILFPGTTKPVRYRSAAEMMNLLAGSDRVKETITRKMTQWALGRPLGKEDEAIVAKIHQTAQRRRGTYESLITAIVLSDLVRTVRTEKRPPTKK
jgi:hypothetical protein